MQTSYSSQQKTTGNAELKLSAMWVSENSQKSFTYIYRTLTRVSGTETFHFELGLS